MGIALAPKVNFNSEHTLYSAIIIIMLSLDSINSIETTVELNYEKIDSKNIHILKQQNSLLFPVIYPDSFYRNLLSSPGTSAYLGTK